MRLAGEVVRRGRGWWEGGAAREIGVGDVLVGGIVLANICSLLAVIAFQRYVDHSELDLSMTGG